MNTEKCGNEICGVCKSNQKEGEGVCLSSCVVVVLLLLSIAPIFVWVDVNTARKFSVSVPGTLDTIVSGS